VKYSYKGCIINISPLRKNGELFTYDRVITVHTGKSSTDHQVTGDFKADSENAAIEHIVSSAKKWIDDNLQ